MRLAVFYKHLINDYYNEWRGLNMDIKVVNDKLVQVIKAPEDDAKYQAFVGAYAMLLDSVKVNVDTVNIAIDSVDIDQR